MMRYSVTVGKRFANLRLRCDVDFVLLLGLVLLSFVPILNRRIIPVHDTLQALQAFQVFYNELYFHHELAQWLPYGTYGNASVMWQLTGLAPASYLLGLAGWLCGCQDVLLLYKLSMGVEQVLFLLGLYLLARRLYAYRVTRFLVCLAASLTVTWFSSIGLDWRMFYLLPLILYLLVRFFEDRQSHFLWQAGIVATATLPGVASYFGSMLFFLLTVIGVALGARQPRAVMAVLRPSRKGLVFLALFLLASGAYLWHAAHSLDGLVCLSKGRDPVTAKATVEEFLQNGPGGPLPPMQTLFTGWPPLGDNTSYIGLLPLLCLAWALLRVKSPVFWAFFWGALALVVLSCAGVAARLLYHFPLMSYYRHIGLLFGLVKFLLLVCAGFGLDGLLRKAREEGLAGFRPSVYHLVTGLLAGVLVADLFLAEPGRQLLTDFRRGTATLAGQNVVLVYLRIALILAGVGLTALLARLGWVHTRASQWSVAGVFLLAFLFDLGSYRWVLHQVAPRYPSPEYADVFRCSPLPFRETRSDTPPDESSHKALDLYLRQPEGPPGRAKYAVVYNALQFDPGRPFFRTDLLPQRVEALIRTRGGKPKQWPDDDFLPSRDQWLNHALGYGTPRLRLVRRPLWVDTADQALALIRDIPVASDRVVLEGAGNAGPLGTAAIANAWRQTPTYDSASAASPIPTTAESLQVLGFSASRLTVKATVATGGPVWLVYADGYDEGWRCTINGKRVPVLKADYAFKAIELQPGENEVRFVFGDWSGLLRSYLVALFGIVFTGAGLFKIVQLAFFGGAQAVRPLTNLEDPVVVPSAHGVENPPLAA
jgi:hypothetical protein